MMSNNTAVKRRACVRRSILLVINQFLTQNLKGKRHRYYAKYANKIKKLTENCKRKNYEGEGKPDTSRTQRYLNYGVICCFAVLVVKFIRAFIRFQITANHWLV